MRGHRARSFLPGITERTETREVHALPTELERVPEQREKAYSQHRPEQHGRLKGQQAGQAVRARARAAGQHDERLQHRPTSKTAPTATDAILGRDRHRQNSRPKQFRANHCATEFSERNWGPRRVRAAAEGRPTGTNVVQ